MFRLFYDKLMLIIISYITVTICYLSLVFTVVTIFKSTFDKGENWSKRKQDTYFHKGQTDTLAKGDNYTCL